MRGINAERSGKRRSISRLLKSNLVHGSETRSNDCLGRRLLHAQNGKGQKKVRRKSPLARKRGIEATHLWPGGNMADYPGRVLIIAGSDSGGSAGIQADIKTVTALGGYAATAITAITVQNTLGVSAVHAVPVDIVVAQARAVLDDIGADIIKTGMLGTPELVEAVADLLADYPAIPLVLDPVMIATSGDQLVSEAAARAIGTRLVPRAALVTPNAPEAEKLTGLTVATTQEQADAGKALVEAGAQAALVKGGHLAGDIITDVLVTPQMTMMFETGRQHTTNTHGTGCTLASAIAAHLAQGHDLPEAIEQGGRYLSEAIRRAPGFGSGHGPVHHAWRADR